MQRLNGCGARSLPDGPRRGGWDAERDPNTAQQHIAHTRLVFYIPLFGGPSPFIPTLLVPTFLSLFLPAVRFRVCRSRSISLFLSLYLPFSLCCFCFARSLRSPPFFTGLSCEPLLDEKKEVTGEEDVDREGKEGRMRLNVYLNGNRF